MHLIKTKCITLIIIFRAFVFQLYSQQVLTPAAGFKSSSYVGTRYPSYVYDLDTVPRAQDNFYQSNSAANNWIQYTLSKEYEITKVELFDINNPDMGEFNKNLFLLGAANLSEFDGLANISNFNNMTPIAGFFDFLSVTNFPQGFKAKYIRLWDPDAGGIRICEMRVYGKEIGAESNTPNYGTNSSAPTSNDRTAVIENEVPISQRIDEAISKKDMTAITKFLKDNNGDFTQQHIDNAFTKNAVDIGKRIASATSLKPGEQTINQLLNTGKVSVVMDLLNTGIIQGTPAMFNQAIQSNQTLLTNYLALRIKPNSETFVLLANDGNSELFEKMIDNDNRVPDNRAINVAIDKNNTTIVNLGLSNGGNANEALAYAMSKNNTEMVKLIVTKKNVDVSKAFKYAVEKDDESLFSSLLAVPSADAKLALDEAMKAKKYEMAMLALETKKTTPTKYLKTAVEAGNIELAKKIVAVGGDANAGMEPAIAKNNLELVEFFITSGATTTNPKYIQNAAVAGSLEIIKLLVENGAAANNAMENAALNGREDAVAYLLEKGADPNLSISLASHAGSLAIVKMLVEKGAAPSKGVENAVAQNKADILNFLIQSGAELSSPKLVPLAVTKNYTAILKILAENGAAVTGDNLLQIAAANGNTEITAVLIANKYNPEEGMLPAIQKNRAAVLHLLIEKGAALKDHYVTDAVNYKAAATIPVLAAAGANFKIADGLGNTLLHTAVMGNDAGMVEELIKAGVPLDAQNAKGNTALHIAADKNDNVQIIMLLAKAGANLNIKNNRGNTPREVAPLFSRAKKTLKDLGAQ